jgi:PAS domain S-box-containing protein
MNGLAEDVRDRPLTQVRYHAPARVSREQRLGDNDLIDILMEHGSQSVAIISPDGGAVKLSPNFSKITGAEPDEQKAEGLFDRFHPQHVDKFRKRLREFLYKEKPITIHYQMRHVETGWRWVEFTLTKRYQNAVICLARDVTEETKDRQQLHKTMLEAELALKARSEFLAHLSHELRTPLNAILGFTQMIESKVFGELGDARYASYVADIKESGQTLLSKLGDLFEIAYIDAGYTGLDENVVQLDTLFAQAVEILSHHAFTQQVRIRMEPTQFSLRVDRLKLLKVLLCLMSNAIKFNRSEGEVILSAELHRFKGLMITVADTGQGIPERQLEQIQTVLNHEESFLARDRDHAGTGLALAGELVRMHGGSIEVETELGEGTHFSILLPRERLVRGLAKKEDKSAVA